MSDNKPNIIHIGYMRAGSTFLRSYFTQHPDINWTRKAWYFQVGAINEASRQEYLSFFCSQSPCKCFIDMYEGLSLGYIIANPQQKDYSNIQYPEWSSEWALKCSMPMDGKIIIPGHDELARRIKYILPEARILIVLRNQVDWLRSMYLHYSGYLSPGRMDFIDFLDTLEGKSSIAAACYDRTLEAYGTSFGKDRVHVILLEELEKDEDRVLAGLCEFLGISFQPMDQSRADKNKAIHSYREINLKKINFMGRLRRLNLMNILVRGRLDEYISGDVLTENEKAVIRSQCSVSNFRTSIWLGCDLSRWGYFM